MTMPDVRQISLALNSGLKAHFVWHGKEGLTLTILNRPGSAERIASKATLKDRDKLTELLAFFEHVRHDLGDL